MSSRRFASRFFSSSSSPALNKKAASSAPSVEALEHRTLLTTLPTGFTDSVVASGLTSPSSMEFSPDGRLFVTQQSGQILVVKNGAVLATPFATLTDVDDTAERGLLGVTFDPNFAQNHYVYAFYTALAPASHNRIARFTANGDVAAAGSEVDLFDLPNVNGAIWHMGGAIHFGPDGKLYISVGDYQVPSSAQDLSVVTGKILRINSDGSIPTDNPFYTTTTGTSRAIWAYGLRNPFSTAFQPSTGLFYIDNVGENTWETIYQGRAGANYGWPNVEGPRTDPQYDQPVYTYNHGGGGGATIAGGFYTNVVQQFPTKYANQYFFADFAMNWIRTMDPTTHVVSSFASKVPYPTSVKVSPDGSLWVLDRGGPTGGLQPGMGQLEQIKYTLNSKPTISLNPKSQLVSAGSSVTFTASASGTAPLTYQWQRNNVNIPGATSPTYLLSSAKAADSGAKFHLVVTNAFGKATSTDAVLTVTAAKPPAATISLTPNTTLYTAGDTFTATATATDPADGKLPASALTWQVDFQHDTHAHPFVPPTSGVDHIAFTIPRVGEHSANVWYRIYLTVKNSAGLTTTVIREVHPRTATITINTNVPGLKINLDAAPQTLPVSILGVAGITRTLGAPLVENVGGVAYVFDSWSDGKAATHDVAFPLTTTIYTAKYHAEKTTYLSSLTPAGTPTNGWGPPEKDTSNGEAAAGDGNPITLNGVVYPRGLGVHAASEQIFNLNGTYDRFVSDVGVDDEVSDFGSVIFQVYLDGTKVFDSGRMTGDSPTQTVNLSVAGKKQLRLVVTDAGDGNGSDHADWAGAELLSNIPLAALAGLRGNVINDANHNGIWDTGDTRLAGWTVFIDTNKNGKLDTGEQKTVTDSLGSWWFSKLVPGTYSVRVVPPAGWKSTSPSSGAYTVTLLAGQTLNRLFCEQLV